MTFDDVMTELEKGGSAQTRKTYARHGVKGAMFGVSYATIGKLVKSIKVDHALAAKLWSTGNHDARVLATMIADPVALSRKQLDEWAGVLDNYPLCGALAKLVARTAHARASAEAWTASTDEHDGQAGWTVYSVLIAASDASTAGALSDDECLALLARIEKGIGAAKNRVRHTMNGTVIAIGGRSPKLKSAAVAAAKRIGVVDVDHGDTACTTPAAATYIEKVWARKNKKKKSA